jgi:hypothetical protein
MQGTKPRTNANNMRPFAPRRPDPTRDITLSFPRLFMRLRAGPVCLGWLLGTASANRYSCRTTPAPRTNCNAPPASRSTRINHRSMCHSRCAPSAWDRSLRPAMETRQRRHGRRLLGTVRCRWSGQERVDGCDIVALFAGSQGLINKARSKDRRGGGSHFIRICVSM